MRTALVLSGGGARGLAHLGVLIALENAGIKPDLIIGCSFGALIGGMYAQHPETAYLRQRLEALLESKEFDKLGLEHPRKRQATSDEHLYQFFRNVKEWFLLNLLIKRTSILKAERLANVINLLIDDQDIKDCQIPFACNATDLVCGSPFLFTEGAMRTAIRASTTIPGYFPPVEHEDKLLVDGAVTFNLPIRFARALGADFVIAVDVHPVLHREDDMRNVLDIILRANTITANTLSDETAVGAQILICPPVREYYWYEFDRVEEIIRAGEYAANYSLEELKRQQKATKRRGAFRRLLRFNR